MHVFTYLALAVSSNLDTLGAGLAYGTRKFRLPFSSNLVCAAIPSAGTYVMMVLGSVIRSEIHIRLANVIGAIIILTAGVALVLRNLKKSSKTGRASSVTPLKRPASRSTWGLLPFLKELERILDDPFGVVYHYSRGIDTREALVLALALTLNNLSCGLAAGLMGLNALLMVGASFLLSLVLFPAGIALGLRVFARWFGEKGDLAAGVILILLGIYELLT